LQYAESFQNQGHLDAIVSQAQKIVSSALKSSGPGSPQAEGQA
jgi:hypothetical protein